MPELISLGYISVPYLTNAVVAKWRSTDTQTESITETSRDPTESQSGFDRESEEAR